MSSEPTNVLTLEASRRERHPALAFGLFGLASGCIVWALLYLLHLVSHRDFFAYLTFFLEYPLLRLFGSQYYISLDESSLLPGIVFGVVIGVALYRRRLASVPQIGIYASAATASHVAAYSLAVKLAGHDSSILDLTGIGMMAGLLGATCLTVLSLLIFPFIRHWRPCLLMVLAGVMLGGLLGVALLREIAPFGLLILYGPWQAGYAAALGSAVPRRALRPDGPAGGP